MLKTLTLASVAALALAGCSSSGGVVDSSDVANHWTGMHVDQLAALWGKPASSTPVEHGTHTIWNYRGCEIRALVRDSYVAEIRTRASDPDACNIVYAKSRPRS